MVAVFCNTASHLSRVLAALPTRHPVRVAPSWRQLQRVARDATVLIVVIPRLSTQERRSLERLTARRPTGQRIPTPVVLVTEWEMENARCVKGLAVEEVIWLPEVERMLWSAAQRAGNLYRSLRQRLVHDIQGIGRIPSKLRDALEYACRSEQPVVSVAALARAVRCSRATLGRYWHRAMGAQHGWRLEDILDWLLLIHAFERKTPERSWENIADELGLYGSALSRLARRLTGRTLGHLARCEPSFIELSRRALLDRFVSVLATMKD